MIIYVRYTHNQLFCLEKRTQSSDEARRQNEMEKMVTMAKAEYERTLREAKQQAEHAEEGAEVRLGCNPDLGWF